MGESRNKKTDGYINGCLFTHKGVADNINLPCEKAGVGRTLELDFVCAIVPACIGPGVGNVRDFEGRNDNPIGLVVS